ncbi:MAG: helix-turn-helix domain-containing protein [Propionibacteriaceae bacterium]|jgi:transcriptional regulator with XRE-family HTH domain|nr:helix-turn-helix domain-containing protein [Propionibacteriaceae bacterium]
MAKRENDYRPFGTEQLQSSHDLVQFGDALTRWRKSLGFTAELTARRAGISPDTLRAIEHGTGSTSLMSVFQVMRVLGVADEALNAVEPLNSEFGRLVADRAVRKRVRMP